MEVAWIPMDHINILHMIIYIYIYMCVCVCETHLAIDIYDWTAATNHTGWWASVSSGVCA